MTDEQIRRTPLFTAHRAAGARTVPFAGWDLPLQYRDGIIAEVRAVRSSAGMFDVSHMGRLQFAGPGAVAFLGTVLATDVADIAPGRARYTVMCNEAGGIIDDLIVYRITPDQCLMIVNAGNAGAVLGWILPQAHAFGGVSCVDLTADIAMIAVQGPEAASIVDRLCPLPASSIRPFRIRMTEVAGIPARVSRTGYTGEDGFEIMPPSDRAVELWDRLAAEGVVPCGLGARDVLRLEAGFLLHGADISSETNPYEAGLERFTDIDTPGYVAADALREIQAAGTPRVLVGFRMIGRGIPRRGQALTRAGEEVGFVTSGTHSPTLDANIGMGYVDREVSRAGTRFEVDVRGRMVEAEVVNLPFHPRRRS